MNPEQQARLQELYNFMQSLKSSNSIPLTIDQAFRGRFGLPKISGKSATSENHAVNEGGGASYSVLGPPDAFLQVNVDGTVYYIPAYQ